MPPLAARKLTSRANVAKATAAKAEVAAVVDIAIAAETVALAAVAAVAAVDAGLGAKVRLNAARGCPSRFAALKSEARIGGLRNPCFIRVHPWFYSRLAPMPGCVPGFDRAFGVRCATMAGGPADRQRQSRFFANAGLRNR